MSSRMVLQVVVAAQQVPADIARVDRIIGNITDWVVGLLVTVSTLFLTIGGLRRIASGGDPSEVEKSNTALRSALLGYALAMAAPLLLAVVQHWIRD